MNQNYNQAPQQQYQAPPPQYGMPMQDTSPMTIGQWVVTIIVLFMIPLVNIIMLFVWGFGSGNVNRKNFCKAVLIIGLIGGVLYAILFAAVLGPMFSNLMNGMGGMSGW
jgi:preprotein translocase subunit SecF